jgi:hypothetical protein
MSDDKPPFSSYLYKIAITCALLTALFFCLAVMTRDLNSNLGRLTWISLICAGCFYIASLIASTWER